MSVIPHVTELEILEEMVAEVNDVLADAGIDFVIGVFEVPPSDMYQLQTHYHQAVSNPASYQGTADKLTGMYDLIAAIYG